MKQELFGRKRLYQKFFLKSGDKFGRLTYTGLTHMRSLHGRWIRYIEAVCDCGEVKEYLYHLVISGETKSCGCFRQDVTRKRQMTHGLSNHKLYDVWLKMIERCYNTKDDQYKDYGGRGIEVWKDWKESFIDFYEWAIGNGYKEGLTLDRNDNDGFYAPYNCSFKTRAEQNRNKRSNRIYTAFGETKCLWDWAKDSRCKVTVWGLRSRIDRGETDMEKALSGEMKERKEISRHKKDNIYLTAFGETKCMSAWLEDERCVVKLDALRDRYRKGWEHEKIITYRPQSSGLKGIKNKKAVIVAACK